MSINAKALREDFPELKKRVNGRELIYFDNAATSLKPIQVIETISNFYKEKYANVGRGVHTLSREATELYEEARAKVAKFIGAGAEEIVFVKNATEAINFVALIWAIKNLHEGDKIVTTYMEHHSNLLPWIFICKRKKVDLKMVKITQEGTLDLNELDNLIKDSSLVTIVHKSNVTGVVNDVKKIAKLSHSEGARILVDGAQSVPHMRINVREMDCDFLAFSGHKMLGPTGIGVLYIKREVYEEIEPLLLGGGIVTNVQCRDNICSVNFSEPPRMLEAGTPNLVGAVGLVSAIDYIQKVGVDNIKEHEKSLTEIMLEELESMNKVRILGPLNSELRTGIVSFCVEDMDPHEVAVLLDLRGIAVRSGFHCAQPLHEILGAFQGSVRASFYLYNTEEEVIRTVEVIKEIINNKT